MSKHQINYEELVGFMFSRTLAEHIDANENLNISLEAVVIPSHGDLFFIVKRNGLELYHGHSLKVAVKTYNEA